MGISETVQDVKTKTDYKGFVRKAFEKYTIMRMYADSDITQLLTVNYDRVAVQNNGDGQSVENSIIKKADAEAYCHMFEKCLKRLDSIYNTILINYYIRNQKDIAIYVNLGMYDRQYYREKKKAIKQLARELIAIKLNVF